MENDEKYKKYVSGYLKLNVWVLSTNVLALVLAVIMFFAPIIKLDGGTYIEKTMSKLSAIYGNEEQKEKFLLYCNKNKEKTVLSLYFSVELISGYFGEESTGDEEKIYNEIILSYGYLRAYLDTYGDGKEFKEKVADAVEKLSEYQRSVSLYEINRRVIPHTALFKSKDIFYVDSFGSFLISSPSFFTLLALSALFGIFYIFKSIFCLINIDAATKKYYNYCLRKKKSKNPSRTLKNQESFLAQVYVFAFLFELLVYILAGITGIFAKNYCSCLPFMAFSLSPFAYILLGLETVIFFVSLHVVALKRKLRNNL